MGRITFRLMRDLKVPENVKLKNYLRMELDVFEDLLLLVVIIYSTLVYYDLSTPEGTETEIQLPLKRSSRFQRLFPNPSWLM